jgi:hypothetical protein
MSIYSKRLLQAGGLTGSVSATVPDGKIWILRDLDCVVHSGDPGVIVLHGAGGQDIYIGDTATTSTTLWYGWRGRQILVAGETVTIEVAAGNWDATLSGYELTSS